MPNKKKEHNIIKDSGKKRKFVTGSIRDCNTNKGRWDLLPFLSLSALAKHFQVGGIKYNDRNWEKGQNISTYMDCAFRHLAKHCLGLKDEQHDIAAAWNILCAHHTKRMIELGKLPKELDDLPKLDIKPEDF